MMNGLNRLELIVFVNIFVHVTIAQIYWEENESDQGGVVETEQGEANEEVELSLDTNDTEVPCGQRPPDYRIVNGREAVPHSWPWIVSFVNFSNKDGWGHFCGGTLISRNKIITAAHCFKSAQSLKNIRARLGSHRLSELTDGELEYKLLRVELHENFTYKVASMYDIAMVTLSHPVSYSSTVSPLCIARPNQLLFADDIICYVVGWGYTFEGGMVSNVLQELELPLYGREKCEESFGTEMFNKTIQICGGYETGGKDACNGDSGGPLVCKTKNEHVWRLEGIVSWGRGCARKNSPAVFTRVSRFTDWILDQLT